MGKFVLIDYDLALGHQHMEDERYKAIGIAMETGINQAKKDHPEFFVDSLKKAKVRLIIIFPEHRGKGYLTPLFEAIETIAKERGYDCILMTATAP